MPRGEPQIQKGGAEGGSFPAPEEVAHTYPGTIPQERPIVMTAPYRRPLSDEDCPRGLHGTRRTYFSVNSMLWMGVP